MNLFLKIFLWFLAAIFLMVGVVIFLTWTVQTEPVVSRWQIGVRNQMAIYSATAGQIYAAEGDAGLRAFTDRLRSHSSISEVDIITGTGDKLIADAAVTDEYKALAARAIDSGNIEFDNSPANSTLAATKMTLQDGREFAFILRWTRPQSPSPFGESDMRYLRLIALLATALVVCYALTLYLTSPIKKVRLAAQKLAGGDLETRVGDNVGNRRDELSGLARDFDEMAERIEQLVTSQQRLTRDISHELRSPLARMGVALEIARKKTNPETEPMLERLERESTRLNEMILSLLTLSRLESGEEFEKKSVAMRPLVERIVEDADFEARGLNRSVKLTSAADCSVSGSDSLLQRAIENVVRNAVKYTGEGTDVNVALRADEKDVTIAISDHGGGVPANELAKLFRPFYRVGEARERKTGGIGLGLAIADQAIKAHRGSITARNIDDGLLVEIKLKKIA